MALGSRDYKLSHLFQLSLVLLQQDLIYLDFGRSESWGSNELKTGIAAMPLMDEEKVMDYKTNPTSFLANHKNGFSKL